MAALVVAASLGLVAYELKQSRDIAAAELTISTQARNAETKLFLVRPEIYASAREKLIEGIELTTEEAFTYATVIDVTMMNIDSVYLLYTQGLLAEGEWQAWRMFIKHQIKHNKMYREALKPEFIATRPEMLLEIQEIWEEVEAEGTKF